MKPPKSSKRAKAKTKNKVNWLHLPHDLMIKIFTKLGTIELLRNAQRVCSSWRSIAKDPQLYRIVNFYDPWTYFDFDGFVSIQKAAKLAIGRSLGQLVEFSIEFFCTDEILRELVKKAPQMKCLRMTKCSHGYSDDCLIEVIGKLPLLEEVEFIRPSFGVDVLEAVGRSCPKLKSFRLNGDGEKLPSNYEDLDMGEWFNEEAFAIAANLNPALRSLHLLGNSMKNNGLEAILERFTQLEYLDLRRCANLDLKGDLLKKCQGIKTLRLPYDSIEDYQFQVAERNMCHVANQFNQTLKLNGSG